VSNNIPVLASHDPDFLNEETRVYSVLDSSHFNSTRSSQTYQIPLRQLLPRQVWTGLFVNNLNVPLPPLPPPLSLSFSRADTLFFFNSVYIYFLPYIFFFEETLISSTPLYRWTWQAPYGYCGSEWLCSPTLYSEPFPY